MKKLVLFLTVLTIAFSSCKKESSSTFDATAQATTDDAAIQAYLKANNITTAVKDPSGLYYRIVTPGTGVYPSKTSSITVSYTGILLDGTQFDKQGSFQTQLVDPTTNAALVIQGWVIGIPHINTGGRIVLYIPSGLGYGNTVSGSIPVNSVLIFTIDLLGIK
jgi:FKBP-type peptidyl-prolyl cis-trans isomerase FkpA